MNKWNTIRLVLLGLIIAGGLSFMIFAIFFNRAELQISAEAPFELQIIGQRFLNCDKSPCSAILAPGKYTIKISKQGYQDISEKVELPLGNVLKKQYQLIQIPQIQTLDAESPEAKELKDTDRQGLLASLPSENRYFFPPSGNTVYFLADNPNTYLPSLYSKDLSQPQQEPQLHINFLRKVGKPLLEINPEQTKIALIDQLDAQNANLYLLDLQTKTRNQIIQNDLISGALWLPALGEKQFLLVEKINRETLAHSLYLIDSSAPTVQQALSIQAPLTAVLAYSTDQVIYAEQLTGAGDGTMSDGFNLKLFDIQTQLSRDLFTVPDRNIPQKMKFQSKTRILLMLIDGTVYSLSPIL